MTEDEATTKWCCGPEHSGRVVRNIHDPAGRYDRMCIGSACMAWIWRWVPGETSKTNGSCGYAGDHGTLDHSGR